MKLERRIITALLLLVLGVFIIPVKAQQTPMVYVKLPNGTGSSIDEYIVCNTFKVDIVADSPDIGIWSWSAGIHFNNTILECTDIGQGDFFDGNYTLGFIEGNINNTLGYVTISGNSLRDPETTGVRGSGVLMWFKFHVIGYGDCTLDLTESPPDLECGVKLNKRVDSSVLWIDPIELTDGSFMSSRPVGGVWIPVDKLGLLAPWIGLASTIILATAILFKFRKKRLHIKS